MRITFFITLLILGFLHGNISQAVRLGQKDISECVYDENIEDNVVLHKRHLNIYFIQEKPAVEADEKLTKNLNRVDLHKIISELIKERLGDLSITFKHIKNKEDVKAVHKVINSIANELSDPYCITLVAAPNGDYSQEILNTMEEKFVKIIKERQPQLVSGDSDSSEEDIYETTRHKLIDGEKLWD